jgi:NTE family protein
MTIALVLGAGGLAGVAWEAGVVTGLRGAGIDLADADRFVGTSAGAVVGTLLAGRVDLATILNGRRPDAPPVRPDWERGSRAFALLNSGRPTKEVRVGIGALALEADVGDEEAQVAAFASWLPVDRWPDRPLHITAVDALTGEFVAWSRDSGVPLVRAVAASCAVPCVFPPVTVDGRRYIDGGVRSGTNADVAGEADVVVVLAPLAGLRSYGAPGTELDALRARAKVVLVTPDAAAQEAFGPTMMDPSRQVASFAAGLAQGAAAVPSVAAVWAPRPDRP